jgi:hypothetical protein
MSSPSATLTFPHPDLTKIVGPPANKTLQVLQKQLFANARAIHSTRGGGAYGHLALVMPEPAYLVRTNGIPFEPPIHPGAMPIHGEQPTGNQITETNRAYAQALAEHKLFATVSGELKKQVLLAVDVSFLTILEDPIMGFADIAVIDMLDHLNDEYGQITNEELEKNRTELSNPWNPDLAIEGLWVRIQEVQRYAITAGETISDATAIRLTLPVLEATGVFSHATEQWREKDEEGLTLDAFKTHFKKANKERIRKLTAQSAGYHGAHSANAAIANATAAAATAAAVIAAGNSAGRIAGQQWYYCWSHGMNQSCGHDSPGCNHKKDGHKDDATLEDTMGGSRRFTTLSQSESGRAGRAGR